MMNPVPGARNFYQPMVPDDRCPAIGLRILRPALHPPKQQHWTDDLPQNRPKVLNVMAVRRENAGVVIKLPNQRTIRIPIGAMQGEMAGHLVGEMRVRLLHARHGGFQIPIAARFTALGLPDVLYPAAEALRCWFVDAVGNWKPQTLDGHGLTHTIGVNTGI